MPDHTKGAAPDAPRRKRRAGVKPALIEVANEQPHFEVADGAVETSDIGDTPQTAIQAANALTDRVVPDGDTSSTARQVLAQLRAPGATEAARRRAGQLLLRAYSRRMIGVACRKFRLIWHGSSLWLPVRRAGPVQPQSRPPAKRQSTESLYAACG